jgi:hypothetical protein
LKYLMLVCFLSVYYLISMLFCGIFYCNSSIIYFFPSTPSLLKMYITCAPPTHYFPLFFPISKHLYSFTLSTPWVPSSYRLAIAYNRHFHTNTACNQDTIHWCFLGVMWIGCIVCL